MALATYADLTAAIALWGKRTDLTTIIPDFVTLAEARINSELRIAAMETAYSQATTAGTPTIALPTRFREFKSIYIDQTPKKTLRYVSPEVLYRDYSDSNGTPSVYTRMGTNLVLGVTPDAVFTVKGIYYQGFAALSGALNTLFADHPDVYLFGAMMEFANYTKNTGDLQIWTGRYQAKIAAIKQEDWNARYSGSTMQATNDMYRP